MGLKEWWNRLGEDDSNLGNFEEEFKEEDPRLLVRVFEVKGEQDADDIIDAVHSGKVIALISSRHMKDGEELKNVMLRVKEASQASDAKIVGLPERWFLVTPKEVGIYRKEVQT